MAYKVDTLIVREHNIPKLKINWGQCWPENMYCPNKIAGSAPVAMAMMYSYFNIPCNIMLTFEGRPTDYINADWEKLKKHVHSSSLMDPTEGYLKSHYTSCPLSEESHQELACLIREFGVIGYASYHFHDFTPSIWKLPDFMKKFMADHEYFETSASNLYNDLKESDGLGVLQAMDGSYVHDWLADGTTKVIYDITTYYNYKPASGEYESRETRTDELRYIHYNWCLSGKNNGYFLENVFDMSKGSDYNLKISRLKEQYNFPNLISAYIIK